MTVELGGAGDRFEMEEAKRDVATVDFEKDENSEGKNAGWL